MSLSRDLTNPRRLAVVLLPALALLLAVPASVRAQAAASATFFGPASECSTGSRSSSTKHVLVASFGSGVAARRASSARFVLTGGFVATLDAPVVGRPWLVGVTPLYAPMKGGQTLSLRGTELGLGTSAGVTIGGRAATIASRTRSEIRTTLPAQPAPGWQPVVVSAGGGRSSLSRGIGVLPMLDVERAPLSGLPFELLYRGSQGDLVVWMLATSKGPKIPVPPFGHGFELDLLGFLVLTATAVPAPDGIARLRMPGVPWSRLCFQSLVLTQNAGYAPGSFTNALVLR